MAKANYSYFLKGTDKEMDVLCVRISLKGKYVRLSTGLKLNPKFWSQDAQAIVRKNNEDYAYQNEKLSKITAGIEKVIRDADLDSQDLEDIRNQVGLVLDPDYKTKSKKGVLALYREWAMYGTATKLNPTRQNLQCCRVFEEFLNKKDVPFDKVDYGFYSDFILFLRNVKKYKENTVGTHIKNLKAVMNEGLKRKLHSNEDFKEFKKPTEKIVNINLTEAEIEQIRLLNLSGQLEQIRDIFIVGCYVAQRHSDYSTISQKDITDGKLVIIQEKTNHRIIIPIHPIVQGILNKYNGELPHVNQVTFNEGLKSIAFKAGITAPVFVRYTKAGKRIEEYVEKWKLVSSHTARKSGVTNALRAGVPIEDCMYLAGIYDIRTFKIYAGMTDEEYSARLAGSSFFSGEKEDIQALIDYATKIIRSNKKTAPEWLKLLREEFKNLH